MKSRSNYAKRPDWDTSSKQEARLNSIINPYRAIMGRESLPFDRQYWTMCGAHYKIVDEKMEPARGELGQMIAERFILPTQWQGVDKDDNVVDNNRDLFPEVCWHAGDFKDVMATACINGSFNPGLINYDGVMGPKFGLPYLKSIMLMIDANIKHDLLLVANFVLRSPYRANLSFEPKDVISMLVDRNYKVPDHWKIVPKYWGYKGGASDKSHAGMGTFLFVKEKHDGINRFTPNRNLLMEME